MKGLNHTGNKTQGKEWTSIPRPYPAMDEDPVVVFVLYRVAWHARVITWTVCPRRTSSSPCASACRSAPLAKG